MRVGNLFAGIGGFDLAAERVGMEVAWQSEIDKHASRVLAHHWPEVTNYGDIHDMGLRRDEPEVVEGSGGHGQDREGFERLHISDGERTYDRSPTRVDVLTGGFPCQDYSVAGTRGGLAGDRGALWWEYHRLIAGLRPTWIVGENVPGLLSSRGGADFETIIRSLTELGYGVVWAVLDAQYFGVAQRRRRVFIVGHSAGEPRPEVLALSEGLFGHPAPSRETGEGATASISTSLKASGKYDHVGDEAKLVAFAWRAGGNNSASGAWEYEHSPTLPAGQTLAVFAQNQRDELRDEGNIVTTPDVRRLTPLECERLQGFPDGWTDIEGNSDTQRYRQLGNAVAVPVAEWILRRISET